MAAATIDDLTPKQREVYDLRTIEGMEPDAIAKRMKISRNGVYVHLRRIRDRGLLKATGSGGNGRKATTPTRRTTRGTPASPNGRTKVVEEMEKAQTQIREKVASIREHAEARITAIDDERTKLAARIEALTAETNDINGALEEADKLEAALK